MKKMRYPILLLALLLGSKVKAQTTQSSDASTVAGHFEINSVTSSGDTSHVNVNYAIFPAPFLTNMNLELSTPDPVLLTADVVNSSGSALIHWAPATSSNVYNSVLDISSLSAGSYSLKIRKSGSTDVLYSIPFTKL